MRRCGLGGITAIHIIAHDAASSTQFAPGALSEEMLARHVADLARVDSAMANEGMLLLWGCETGRHADDDEMFVDCPGGKTGAPVAVARGPVVVATRGGR